MGLAALAVESLLCKQLRGAKAPVEWCYAPDERSLKFAVERC